MAEKRVHLLDVNVLLALLALLALLDEAHVGSAMVSMVSSFKQGAIAKNLTHRETEAKGKQNIGKNGAVTV